MRPTAPRRPVLRPIPDLRPGEARPTLAAAATLFGLAAALAVLRTASDALFLGQLPAVHLAFAQLAVAVLVLVALVAPRRRLLASGAAGLSLGLFATAAAGIALWRALLSPATWALHALYVGAGVVAALTAVRFWTATTELFDVRQRKRVLPSIVLAGLLGAAFGAGLSAVLASRLEARHLLVVASALLIATGLVAAAALPRPRRPSARAAPEPLARELRRALREVAGSAYLRRLAAMTWLACAAVTLVDLLFKVYVAEAIDPARLGTVFGTTYLSFHLLALLCQLFLVSWLLRALAVERLLALFPLALVAAGLAVGIGGGLLAVFLARAVDGALRPTLERRCEEVRKVPAGAVSVRRTRTVLDVALPRTGEALAALALATVAAREVDLRILGFLVAGLTAAWAVLALTIHRPYLARLRRRVPTTGLAARLARPDLASASLDVLLAQLSDPSPSAVLAALEEVTARDRIDAVPSLLLYHPAPEVVVRALELFREAGRDADLERTEPVLESPAAQVRSAALRARFGRIEPGTHLPLLADSAPGVRATALASFTQETSERADEARAELDKLLRSGAVEGCVALADLARDVPGSVEDGVLVTLADHDEVEVRLAVVAAMGRAPHGRLAGRLVRLLADPALRVAVRRALLACGEPALAALRELLVDASAGPTLRRLAAQALGDFPPAPAARILLEGLLEETDPTSKDAVLGALFRLQATTSGLRLDPAALDERIRLALQAFFVDLAAHHRLEELARREPLRRTPGGALLADRLRYRVASGRERLFLLVELRHGGEVVAALRSGRPDKSAATPLEPGLREAVAAALDGGRDTARALARAGTYAAEPPDDPAELLAAAMRSDDPHLRAFAALHAAELDVGPLRSAIEDLAAESAADPGGRVLAAAAELLERGGLGA